VSWSLLIVRRRVCTASFSLDGCSFEMRERQACPKKDPPRTP
jgi:hypothetical protein